MNPTWGKKLPVAVKAHVSPLDQLRLPQVRHYFGRISCWLARFRHNVAHVHQQQIQNAHNYMRMAIGELKRLQRLMDKNGDKVDQRILTEAFTVGSNPHSRVVGCELSKSPLPHVLCICRTENQGRAADGQGGTGHL